MTCLINSVILNRGWLLQKGVVRGKFIFGPKVDTYLRGVSQIILGQCVIVVSTGTLPVNPRPIILCWHFARNLVWNVLSKCLVVVVGNRFDHGSIIRVKVTIQSAFSFAESRLHLLHLSVLKICCLTALLLCLRRLVLVQEMRVYGAHRILEHEGGIWMELLLHQILPNVVV